ncbi:MAG: family 20 glycosylhydrolase [Clostridia bacterium]|nr:family 20 glycosylhydrolase [Clostridia bacterium]
MKKHFAMLLSLLFLAGAVIPATSTVFAANAAPTVLPAIREWKGGSGSFTPNASTVLVGTGNAVEKVKGFFADMLELDLTVSASGDGANEIVFKLDPAMTGKLEGYYKLEATASKITVTAPTQTGLLYGGISIVQSVYADGSFPCGTAIDYPAYAVRSGMIDVARLFMPIEELTDVARYMAWYKLNEIHVHINDNGKNGYSAFRLESDINGLQAEDGYYTKEEYRNFQKTAAEYGVTVITEIDSPHHARCFSTVNINGWTPKLLTTEDGVNVNEAGRALDITDEKTVEFIKDLFTEYLGGDNPVILNDTIHIGMDEYPRIASFAQAAEDYINGLIEHVNSLGYKARFWSSFGPDGFLYGADLNTKLDFDTIYWDPTHADAGITAGFGKGVVNYISGYLYLVPGWKDEPWESFEDYLGDYAMEFIYTKWQVNRYSAWAANPYILDSDDPNMLGASFSIWNDYGSAWIGLTFRDVIDRVRNIAPLVAEKCWNGDDTNTKISYANYRARFDKLCTRAGDVDLFHRDLPDGGINVDFSKTLPDYVELNGSAVSNGKLILNGSNSISLGERYDYVGFPNTLTVELSLDELPAERAYLFASEKGYGGIFIDPDGKIGFESMISKTDKYVFTFDSFKITANETVKLMFTSDMYNAYLAVNDTHTYETVSDHLPLVTAEFAHLNYSTLTVPLEKIGGEIKGTISYITVNGERSETPNGVNVALGKSYTTYNLVSGVITDENKISRLYGASLTDGVFDTNAPVTNVINPSTGKNNCNDGKWFGFFDNDGVPEEENCESGIGYVVIDLGALYDISKIRMHVEKNNAPTSVTVYASETENGTYSLLGTLSGSVSGSAYWIAASASATARYIKLEIDLASYWALFNEIEVYGVKSAKGFETVEHSAVGKTATDLVNNTPLESSNGVFKFGSVLTDGIAQNSVNAANKSWYTFQKWYNCTDNIGSVVVDLGESKKLDKIALHLANSNETFEAADGSGKTAAIDALAPTKIEAFVSDDNKAFSSVGTFEINGDKNVVYWSELDIDSEARYIKIAVSVNTAGAYALLDEIAVYESESVEPEYVVGDVDGNGSISATDYMLLKRSLLGTFELELLKDQETVKLRCDINKDGNVSAVDYALLKRHILGTFVIK